MVSFYTPGTAYEELARHLAASVRERGLPLRIEARKRQATWAETCAQKPFFIREALEKHPRVLWLDADARLMAFPELLRDADADFAVHRRDGLGPQMRFASGTVYFSRRARCLVDRWCEVQSRSPRMWDQEALFRAWSEWEEGTVRSLFLPKPYLTKFDEGEELLRRAVVVHYQQSRREAR